MGTMDQARSRRQTTSALLPIATVVFAIIADTIAHLEIVVAVLYVAVVLMASRFGRKGSILLIPLPKE